MYDFTGKINVYDFWFPKSKDKNLSQINKINAELVPLQYRLKMFLFLFLQKFLIAKN